MLDLALIRAEPARVKAALARRGVLPEAVDAVADLDGRWSAKETLRETLRARRRRIADEVARAKREGGDTSDLQRLGRQVAEQVRTVEDKLAELEAARRKALLALPNLPATDVPDEPRTCKQAGQGRPPWARDFEPLPHWNLMEMLGLVHPVGKAGPGPCAVRHPSNKDWIGRLRRRGFVTWRGQGARLVRALIQFMLDLHTGEHGYEEVRCPALATRDQLTGSAHLPVLEGKMYAVRPGPAAAEEADLWLVPRAEPHLASLYAGQVLEADALPIRLVSAGPAFRREAGSAGRTGRGLLRLHQFPTVELYVFCRPDQSEAELARAAAAAETILERLGLPHRRHLCPGARLSHAATKTIDLAVWAPGLSEWLRVAALSDFTDYQARRTNTRFRGADGRLHLVHTVGGAAVGVPRLLAALLENGQQADGSVRFPPALSGYMGSSGV